ncbi:MAG: hypothetical protein R2695_08565 [Acidimicrobiales bacterium]
MLLTIANFGFVLVGLLAIAVLADDDRVTSLLNVWSFWGVAHVSVGQVLQIVMTRGDGARQVARWAPLSVIAAGAIAIAGASRLFPAGGAVWIGGAVAAVAGAAAAGALRGRLVVVGRADVALAVSALDNALRALLLLVVLPATSEAYAAAAVALPFAVTLPLLAKAYPGPAAVVVPSGAAWGPAVLSTIPSVSSYLILPALSIAGRLPAAVDGLAVDAALSRGPVQVAVFAAPKLLEQLLGGGGSLWPTRSAPMVALLAVLTGGTLVLGSGSGAPARVVAIAATAAVSTSAHLHGLVRSVRRPTAAIRPVLVFGVVGAIFAACCLVARSGARPVAAAASFALIGVTLVILGGGPGRSEERRACLIITGMHRSGTSLVAQVLRELGVDFGPADELYPGDRWNENGYLERLDVIDLNSRIVTGVPADDEAAARLGSQLSYLRMPSESAIARRGERQQADHRARRADSTGWRRRTPASV